MISPSESAYILEQAYVPEHLPDYVSAISGTEPYLMGDFIVHVGGSHLIFVGYPLSESWNESNFKSALEESKARFDPSTTSIIAPALSADLKGCTASAQDEYYRLDLTQLAIPKKTRNMLRRARREVTLKAGKFGREHKKLIKAFLRKSHLDQATRFIFQRVSKYVKCDTAHVYEARDASEELVAFDVADFGARDYAFYMFNFRSPKHNIPGVSDLLLNHIVEQAQARGKTYLNLGLGINPGVAFFKEKWGAKPFLKYTTWEKESPDRTSWLEAFDQLSR